MKTGSVFAVMMMAATQGYFVPQAQHVVHKIDMTVPVSNEYMETAPKTTWVPPTKDDSGFHVHADFGEDEERGSNLSGHVTVSRNF